MSNFKPCYNWSHISGTLKFELTYMEQEGYEVKVASYSLNTKQIILTNPLCHIPDSDALKKFIELCENYQKEEDDDESGY